MSEQMIFKFLMISLASGDPAGGGDGASLTEPTVLCPCRDCPLWPQAPALEWELLCVPHMPFPKWPFPKCVHLTSQERWKVEIRG